MTASTSDAFARALGSILARVCVSEAGEAGHENPTRDAGCLPAIAVAYSGGLDSSALLHLAHDYARTHGLRLHAFHVHHGLSPNADAWLTHCQEVCARLDVAFDARRITLQNARKSGIEESARLARYQALGELCRQHRIDLLLTAHHLDDQAETVLLQLLRGAGVAGLSGMDAVNTAPGLLGDARLFIARPLLGMARAALEAHVKARGIAFVEDESNADPRYARNALRHQVMPALAACFPGYQERVARTARHAQAARQLLQEIGDSDLARCLRGNCLDAAALRTLSTERIDNTLRHWFSLRGIRMPGTAWLAEMRSQILDARDDAQLTVTHPDCHIRRHRGHIHLVSRAWDGPPAPPQAFVWQGEAEIPFPAFRGRLRFSEAGEGIDAEWLRAQTLCLRHRSGGERLKPAANKPTRRLKLHFQALDIPAWERQRLPVVTAADQLLFAAGIGMDCRAFHQDAVRRVVFEWIADPD